MPEELTAKNAAAHGPLNVSALQGLQGLQGASTSSTLTPSPPQGLGGPAAPTTIVLTPKGDAQLPPAIGGNNVGGDDLATLLRTGAITLNSLPETPEFVLDRVEAPVVTLDPSLIVSQAVGSIGFNIAVTNAAGAGLDPFVDDVVDLTAAALENWFEFISGAPGAVIDVAVTISNSLPPGVVASAGFGSLNTFAQVNNDPRGFGGNGVLFVFTPPTLAELSSGVDSNGATPEIVINIGAPALQNGFLDPTQSLAVPPGVTDVVSVFTHEVGHGLGFLSLRSNAATDFTPGNPFTFGGVTGNIVTVYDVPIAFGDSLFFGDGAVGPTFEGATVREVYGDGVQLEFLFGSPGSDISHFLGFSAIGAGLTADTALSILNPAVLPGDRVTIGALELALLSDLGYDVTIPDNIPLLNSLDQFASISPIIQANGVSINGSGQGLVDLTRTGTFLFSSGGELNTTVGVEVTAVGGSMSVTGRAVFSSSSLTANVQFDPAQLFPNGGLGPIEVVLFNPAGGSLPNGSQEQRFVLSDSGLPTIIGTEGDDVLNGTGVAEEILGLGGDDQINGNDGDDILSGGDGNDNINGGAGNDQFIGGLGVDVFQGGDGIDTADFSFATVRLDIDVGAFVSGPSVTATLIGVENVISGSGDDSIFGSSLDNVLNGGAGDDELDGFGGVDTLIGGAGVDTASFFNASGVTINLDQNGNARVSTGANLVSIENLVGSEFGSDFLSGNAAANFISGLAGNDTLLGDGGNDGLDGGAGNDELNGGSGNDTLNGGSGADTLLGGDGDDVIDGGLDVESTNPTILIAAELDHLVTDEVVIDFFTTDLLSGGAGNDTLTGGLGADVLQGDAGNDLIIVSPDNPTFTGPAIINDQVNGGAGIDTLQVNSNVNIIIDLGAFFPNSSFTTAIQGIENVALGGGNDSVVGDSNNNRLEGGDGNDGLNGGAGNDQLVGGAGNDFLIGGAGDDQFFGGPGSDNFVLGAGADIIFADASPGVDISQSSSSDPTSAFNPAEDIIDVTALGLSAAQGLALATLNISGFTTIDFGQNNVLILSNVQPTALTIANFIGVGLPTITGTSGNDILNGTSGAEQILGLGGNDALNGLGGDDILNGGAGADNLIGGAGDDTFIIDSISDVVTELAGQGLDTVQASFSNTLAANVENLVLIGAGLNLNGTGNSLNNVITGTTGNNVLNGAGGNDALNGDAGNDLLNGGDGNDTLQGGAGNDTLQGAAGADVLIGGAGDDIFTIESAFDTVTELAGEGVDTVQASFSNTLAANVENLVLIGAGLNLNGTGNGLNNLITGTSGNNSLNGGGGNDTLNGAAGNDFLNGAAGADVLIGGAGDDTFVIDSAFDTVTELAGQGLDTVQASFSNTLAANVENLVLIGAGLNLNGTGNSLNNLITGTSGNNSLNGGAGNDTLNGAAGNDFLNGAAGADVLIGGAGDDTFVIDSAFDTVTELAGQGLDTVQALFNHTLGANVENLILVGAGLNLNGTGNSLNNLITGTSGNNSLNGGEGNDTLNGAAGDDVLVGAAGADTLIGGTGNDTFIVENIADVVTELVNQGVDLVQSTVNYTLSANVENLALIGAGLNLNGVGNDLNNLITGTSGNNVLNGGAGNDTLNGGAGGDTLIGGAGADTLTGGAGADVFLFNQDPSTGVDTITDFSVVDDVFQLENAIFTTAGPLGALAAAAFVVGASATTAAHRFIYNASTGALFYDEDGVGGVAAQQIAQLGTGLGLTNADFSIV